MSTDRPIIDALLAARKAKNATAEKKQATALVQHHLPWMRAQAVSWSRSTAFRVKPEDYLHELVLEALQDALSFDGRGTFTGWVNCHRPSVERRIKRDYAFWSPTNTPLNDIDVAATTDEELDLDMALAVLSKRHRDVLAACLLNPGSQSQVAERLGISSSRVSQLKSEAIAELVSRRHPKTKK